MPLRSRCREETRVQPVLREVVTPRTNNTPMSALARILASSALPAPFSLEIAGDSGGCTFLVRAGPAAMMHLAQQLGAAYPQAELRPRDVAARPALDPTVVDDGERAVTCALALRAAPYLPLRTFRDAEIGVERTPQADPVLGILAALARLPDGWRATSQLILHPAPPDWGTRFQRLALEHPIATERSTLRAGGPSAGSIASLAGLIMLLLVAPDALRWYDAHDWPRLGLLGGGLAGALSAALSLAARFGRRPLHDPLLVREKLGHSAFRAQLRLAVIGPGGAPSVELLARLDRLVAAYGQFNLPTGNGFRPRALRLGRSDLPTLAALPMRSRPALLGRRVGHGATYLLTAQEVAALWHLPPAQADVPWLERTTARRWIPLPAAVAGGCRLGLAEQLGQAVPVALPRELLQRHLLAVAKTRRGKSSLLLRLAQFIMQGQADSSGPAALLLVDPHRDLAEAALGLVPPHRHDDVVYLDVGEQRRPFGLNLLDTGLGWDADRAVANALMIFRRQWDHFWGPRMEDVFRMTLHTLYAANERRCATDPDARAEQYTILEIPSLLFDLPFRHAVLEEAGDDFIEDWWRVHYDGLLDRRLRLESANPVLTKINRLAASGSSRALLGQPCSTIRPGDWIRQGRLVIVHTAQGLVGEDTAALVGGTLLNLVKQEVQAQAALAPAQRRQVCLIVDEFHSIAGADYEAFLGELAKFGCNLVLATQTLARLESLDRAHDRALRATVFANIDGLFAFHCSAEDARYLVPELGGEVEVADLVSLGEHRCYARISAGRERLPLFSVALDPPPTSDPALATQLAATSAQRHGLPRQEVEAARAAVLARVTASHVTLPSLGNTGRDEGRAAARGPGERRRRALGDRQDQPGKGPRVADDEPPDQTAAGDPQ